MCAAVPTCEPGCLTMYCYLAFGVESTKSLCIGILVTRFLSHCHVTRQVLVYEYMSSVNLLINAFTSFMPCISGNGADTGTGMWEVKAKARNTI